MDPTTPTQQTLGAGNEAPWHESIISKGADGTESLADFAAWKDKAPAPLVKFITDNMTAARAKTDGMLKLPGADAKPEDWDPVWKALGRPDTPDGYGIAKPEKLPDGVEWDDAFAKGFSEFAHATGIPKAQAEKLIAWHTEQMGAQAAAMREAGQKLVEEERAALQKAFGPQLADVAAKAQAAAVAAGLPAEIFDPAAGAFLGAPALQVVGKLLTELEGFKKEGSFATPGQSPVPGNGWDYANAVISGKHPDSEGYWKKDSAIVARVTEGLKQKPKAA